MMKSQLQGIQRRFGPEGLVVVEGNNGAFDPREAVAEEIRHQQPNYAVLWDKQGRTCDAFGVTKYGTAYLIGVNGRVICAFCCGRATNPHAPCGFTISSGV